MKTTLLLVEDHTVVMQGLHALLDADPTLQVIGEAGTGQEGIDKAAELHPDVIVLDMALPDMLGLEVTRRICEQPNHPKIVILSMYATEDYVLEALRSGANAYVLKGSDASELKQAIANARQGKHYLCPPLDDNAIAAYLSKTKGEKVPSLDLLTKREYEVFLLAATGTTSAEIANQLGISPRTAETHRARVMDKLELHSQAEIEAYARQHGTKR